MLVCGCGYRWQYRGRLLQATCPSCGRKVRAAAPAALDAGPPASLAPHVRGAPGAASGSEEARNTARASFLGALARGAIAAAPPAGGILVFNWGRNLTFTLVAGPSLSRDGTVRLDIRCGSQQERDDLARLPIDKPIWLDVLFEFLDEPLPQRLQLEDLWRLQSSGLSLEVRHAAFELMAQQLPPQGPALNLAEECLQLRIYWQA